MPAAVCPLPQQRVSFWVRQSDWLIKSLNLAVLPMLERRWSEASRGHFRNARVEFLKGIRSLIDDRIADLSREERKGTRVTVE